MESFGLNNITVANGTLSFKVSLRNPLIVIFPGDWQKLIQERKPGL
ncbi:MAG: hypothetical protein IPH57_05400 [Saprospiraceae bacterium]|nr:hypothetical protein [Saprospiraceae bacterium]